MCEDIQEDSFSSDAEFDERDASDSSSDVDARLAEDEIFDVEFFKCYSAIKKKDEKIYNNDVKFFASTSKPEVQPTEEEGNEEEEQVLKSRAPKMTLLDYQLNLREEDLDNVEANLNKQVTKSHYEKELEEIKHSIEKESGKIDSDDEDDEDFLKVKDSGSAVKPKRRVDSILSKITEVDDPDVNYLKEYWVNPDKLTEDEKFLRDYILNKRYIPKNAAKEEESNTGFFSKNLEELSDVEEESKEKKRAVNVDEQLEEKVISRIPRNSTKTIRDMIEKKNKREKRLKRIEKEKKKKKSLRDADFEDLVGDLPTRFHYQETEPSGLSAEEILMAPDEELDKPIYSKQKKGKRKPALLEDDSQMKSSSASKKKKKKRGLNHKKFSRTKVAPDRLLSYGLSKTKLKKSKLL